VQAGSSELSGAGLADMHRGELDARFPYPAGCRQRVTVRGSLAVTGGRYQV
jgi:hypothetical protein